MSARSGQPKASRKIIAKRPINPKVNHPKSPVVGRISACRPMRRRSFPLKGSVSEFLVPGDLISRAGAGVAGAVLLGPLEFFYKTIASGQSVAFLAVCVVSVLVILAGVGP